MEKTLHEYMPRLQLLAEQAKLDGNEKVYDFTMKLLAQQNIDDRLIELIFTCFDSLNDTDMDVYDYLLEKKASCEWFEFIGFLSDQRGTLAEYFPILVKAMEGGLDVSVLQEAERTSSGLEDFCRLVENHLSEVMGNAEIPEQENRQEDVEVLNEFIQHLKDENDRLNARLDSVMQENNSYQQEQRNMMKSAISSKRAVLAYKVELEALKKNYEKEHVSLTMTRRKLEKAQELAEKLSKINDELTTVHQKQNDDKEHLEKELYKQKEDTDFYISENEILRKQVAALQQIAEQQINAGVVTDREQNHSVAAAEGAFVNQKEIMEGELDALDSTEEVEDLGYNPEKAEAIRSNEEAVKKRLNFFATLVARHFEKRFEMKSCAEQENLIFVKLMENSFSMDTVRAVKKALGEERSFSRTELYKMVAGRASDESVMRFCGMDV